MGILATLRANGYEIQRMRMVNRQGRENAHVDLTPMRQALQGRFISVARSDLAAPETTLGLAVRNLAVHAFALPFVAKPMVARALRDDFALPEYTAA